MRNTNKMRHTLFRLVGQRVYGQCETMITRDRASINTLNIHQQHQHHGYGSLLLHRVEDYLHLEHNANMVTALVWERQGESTHQFYEKNGYTHMPHEREQHYDDGVSVYDLMPYIKLLPAQLSRRDEYALNDVPDREHLEMQITDYIL